MQFRKFSQLNPIKAGALLGALAAFVVGGISQLMLWLHSNQHLESTGAPQGLDQWSYFSMVRAVWRSPNLITYSYPYELYWSTPPVAFQLPITLLAWVSWLTGLPIAFELGRIVGAAGAGAGIAALGMLFPRGIWRKWFYVAVILGGGTFSVGTLAITLNLAGIDGLTEPHEYLPRSMGRLLWWSPFIAMNLRMPLECIYHAMVIGALACLAWNRSVWAWVLGVAVYASNPFSAIALHAAVIPWLAWRTLETTGAGRRRAAFQLLAWLAVSLIWGGYYGWFLGQWPLFRELRSIYAMEINRPLEWWRVLMLVVPYGAGLAATVLSRPLRRAIWGRSRWRLFAILAVVHIVLMQHTALLGGLAMQAFHYNRGYLHLGLVVVSWRVLVIILHRTQCLRSDNGMSFCKPWRQVNARCRYISIALSLVVVVSCLDQAVFALYSITRPSVAGLVSRSYADLVRQIPDHPARMIVLTETPPTLQGSYVTAFSPHIAWDAQESMIVPYYSIRVDLIKEAMAGKHHGVAGLGIDYAIISRHNAEWMTALQNQGWTQVTDINNLFLLKKPAGHVPNPNTTSNVTTTDLDN